MHENVYKDFLYFTFGIFYSQYETVVPLEDSVITEVTATLQEWAVLWKQLYVVGTLEAIILHANGV